MKNTWKRINSCDSKQEEPQECLHDGLNKRLVESGKAKSIEEAAHTRRFLYCPCKKCNPFNMRQNKQPLVYDMSENMDTLLKIIEDKKKKVPIRRGCPNTPNPCHCTGVCHEIIGYRDKIAGEY